MRIFINTLGTLLILAGLALFGYVGIAYQQGRASPVTSSWDARQRAVGHQLAAQLAKRQRILVRKHMTVASIVPGSESPIRIAIPKIRVDAPIIETPSTNGIWPVADWAVGHLSSSPNPGGLGNMALSAHDDIKGEIFKRLGELVPGDVVRVYTRHALYTYIVTQQLTVDPSAVGVLDSTPQATLTMITCTPYWVDTQRLIIHAMLKSRIAV